MDPILGQIILWPVPWVPQGWALCDGTLLNVQQNAALFALIGTTYGGDGRNTFALPDLRNRVPMGSQNMVTIGAVTGSPTSSTTASGAAVASIGVNNLPAHSHTATFTPSGGSTNVDIAIPVDSTGGSSNTNVPGNTAVLSAGAAGNLPAKIYSPNASNATLKPFQVAVPGGGGTVANANTGGGQPLTIPVTVPVTVSTLQPSLTLNFIIATQGIFPSRP